MNPPPSDLVEANAKLWSGVVPPNAAAVEMADMLAQVIEGFERLRGELQFEDEPATFLTALQATKEIGL
ncbi:hypothetical protein [Bradyrhizobium sp.]|jgi:hypothetical protein|uniref:hypothetical protein n=1 Tax=Bradyrhizobium sp. TaxID=376 RepID=UPI002CEE742B|nr:hypothetical protein [Bradyrhizobium sp.]HWX60494.1 hypothetical protein [Bradyrhizobium sp.]